MDICDKRNIDSNPRYRMPRVKIQIVGNGNGINTLILNLEEIGNALNRDGEIILKFLSYNLGCISNMDKKNLMGRFKEEEIQNLIYDFIDGNVLCIKCRNPETILLVEGNKKNKILKQKCSCCGCVEELKDKNKYLVKFNNYLKNNEEKLNYRNKKLEINLNNNENFFDFNSNEFD